MEDLTNHTIEQLQELGTSDAVSELVRRLREANLRYENEIMMIHLIFSEYQRYLRASCMSCSTEARLLNA